MENANFSIFQCLSFLDLCVTFGISVAPTVEAKRCLSGTSESNTELLELHWNRSSAKYRVPPRTYVLDTSKPQEVEGIFVEPSWVLMVDPSEFYHIS